MARLALLLLVLACAAACHAHSVESNGDGKFVVNKPYFGLRVVDADTGAGIPLVQIRTSHYLVQYTDSAGAYSAEANPRFVCFCVYIRLCSSNLKIHFSQAMPRSSSPGLWTQTFGSQSSPTATTLFRSRFLLPSALLCVAWFFLAVGKIARSGGTK